MAVAAILDVILPGLVDRLAGWLMGWLGWELTGGSVCCGVWLAFDVGLDFFVKVEILNSDMR